MYIIAGDKKGAFHGLGSLYMSVRVAIMKGLDRFEAQRSLSVCYCRRKRREEGCSTYSLSLLSRKNRKKDWAGNGCHQDGLEAEVMAVMIEPAVKKVAWPFYRKGCSVFSSSA